MVYAPRSKAEADPLRTHPIGMQCIDLFEGHVRSTYSPARLSGFRPWTISASILFFYSRRDNITKACSQQRPPTGGRSWNSLEFKLKEIPCRDVVTQIVCSFFLFFFFFIAS
ncbi:hypothetical protein BDV25DRAFT_100186 [Aspergillus avenaceus]|uniref:Uncharacterized protein n=1 Tax=Aspergillus avenaceus TaxID=36643 RepID=A0A5N6TXJ0_ASPAV|nr:hypothetical protein BDV25DRAFT_100186 [Aspergillus avenaceus]